MFIGSEGAGVSIIMGHCNEANLNDLGYYSPPLVAKVLAELRLYALLLAAG
jgi:hypothetical protein